MDAWIYVQTRLHINAHNYTNTQKHIILFTHTRTHTRTHTHTHARMHIHTPTHTCTHTHTHACTWVMCWSTHIRTYICFRVSSLLCTSHCTHSHDYSIRTYDRASCAMRHQNSHHAPKWLQCALICANGKKPEATATSTDTTKVRIRNNALWHKQMTLFM